jgi:hypothetical protein
MIEYKVLTGASAIFGAFGPSYDNYLIGFHYVNIYMLFLIDLHLIFLKRRFRAIEE